MKYFNETCYQHCYFALASSPLTHELTKMNTVYEEHTTKITVSHLLYMDNLKLIGKSEEGPQKQMKIRTFSDDIHKECGLCKCAKIVLKKGVHSQNLILDFNTRA